MQYVLLIYTDESAETSATPEETERVYAAYNEFTKAVRDAGVMVAGEAFHPTNTAQTVSVNNGSKSVTQGPAVSTPLQLGGYYVLECKDDADAAEWAAKIPGAKYGKVETRPLVVFS